MHTKPIGGAVTRETNKYDLCNFLYSFLANCGREVYTTKTIISVVHCRAPRSLFRKENFWFQILFWPPKTKLWTDVQV